MINRILLLILLAGVVMAPQTAQVNSYVNGNVLTADQLNSEFGNIYSTINGLDEDNFLPSTAINPANIDATIDGTGISRSVGGVLSANPDGVTLENFADQIRIKALGVTTAKLASSLTIALDNGTSASPSLNFSASPTTGLYLPSGTSMGFAVSGASTLIMNTQGILNRSATVAAPAYAFSSDTDTGMYNFSADALGFSTGGVVKAIIDSSGVDATITGGAAAPGYSFISDDDTGMYQISGNIIGFSSGGVNKATLSSTRLELEAGVGIATDNQGSAGSIKWKVFTGSLAASGVATLTNPSTILLACSGASTLDGGANYYAMPNLEDCPAGDGTGSIVTCGGIASGNNCRITNTDTNTTNSYRVVMIYQ